MTPQRCPYPKFPEPVNVMLHDKETLMLQIIKVANRLVPRQIIPDYLAGSKVTTRVLLNAEERFRR